jgi:predicted TPR repeat methyltransferase
VSVRPSVVARLTPVDMNVVFQTMPLPPEQRFDLVIGTNIFLYYGALDQSLARANLATMIKPGGFLISNTALPGAAPSKLADSLQTEVPITPVLKDVIYSYVREK